MIFRRHAFAAACLFAGTLVITPAANAETFSISATSADEFRKQAQEMRVEMGSGGKHAGLSPADQSRIGKQLDRLQALYDKRAAGGSLSDRDQVTLVNAAEEINAVLSGAEDDKLVCEQVRKLGSNRVQRVCLTVAQRKAQQEDSRKAMQERRPLGRDGL